MYKYDYLESTSTEYDYFISDLTLRLSTYHADMYRYHFAKTIRITTMDRQGIYGLTYLL